MAKVNKEGRQTMRYTGQPLKRFEDPKLVTGKGCFVDDVQLPDMLHAAILRSPHAHAHLRSIDVAAARTMAGVVAVLTGADTAGVLGDVPTRAMVGGWEVDTLQPVEQPVLARGKVCYVGQPVAIVVAQNRYLASKVSRKSVPMQANRRPVRVQRRPHI
jgi:carbon-monoxide dehydrogenase large subunit